MSSTQLRRLSLEDGDGRKIKKFNVLYPKTIIKQHVLDRIREKERKRLQRLNLQAQQKNTIMSSQAKQSTEKSNKANQRRQISSINLLNFKTPTSRLSDYTSRISSRLSSNSHYEGVKQIFLKTNFKRPKYQAHQLLIVDPYIENKENVSNIYNLRPNKTIDRLLSGSERQKSISTNRNFLVKSPKSHTTLLSVRSLNLL